MLFLRFTNEPEKDLERGTSIHGSDYDSVEEAKKAEPDCEWCETDNGKYVGQILEGLCGYALASDNLEDAIEEIEDGVWQFDYVGKPVIFKGRYSNDINLVPDGDLFIPFSIAKKL